VERAVDLTRVKLSEAKDLLSRAPQKKQVLRSLRSHQDDFKSLRSHQDDLSLSS